MLDWISTERREPDGTVSTEQRIRLTEPVVPATEEGARRLSRLYWDEVGRATRAVVRRREADGHVELLPPLGRRALLRLGPAELTVRDGVVAASHAIEGGFLSRGAGGSITFEQRDGILRCAVDGFRASRWYSRLQARIHVAISRRYFSRLLG